MVMKFVKCISAYLALFLFVSCSTEPAKDLGQAVPEELTLLSSEEFIPAIVRDKDGQPEIYQPKLDPYGNQKGRVNKIAITRFIEAKRQFGSGNLSEAESLANEIIREFDNLSGPWVLLGDIDFLKQNFAEAQEDYVAALAVNDKNINAYLKLALSQRYEGKYLLAQNTYVDALAQWSDFPEAHLNLAVLYDLYLNHPIRAQRHYEAYQFLTQGRDAKVSSWLAEVKLRTGLATKLNVGDDQPIDLNLSE